MLLHDRSTSNLTRDKTHFHRHIEFKTWFMQQILTSYKRNYLCVNICCDVTSNDVSKESVNKWY